MKNKKKGDLISSKLVVWIIAILVLVLFLVVYFLISGKLTGIGEKISHLFP